MSNPHPTLDPTDAASQREARYRALIAMEGDHAGQPDPHSPQLWDDPVLNELVLAGPWNDLVARAVASGGPALELGCGDGDLALALAGRGVDITGVDLSEARVAHGNAEAARRGLSDRATFRAADLNTIVLEPRRYRTIVAHQALHHVLEIERLLDQVAAALTPDGVLLVNDFMGAGRLEKLMSALAVGILPASWPYSAKLRMAARFRHVMASERDKRAAFERADEPGLHERSPFEGISQEAIERGVRARFRVTASYTFCPYWYHAMPKLRMPRALRRAWLRAFHVLDGPLNRRGITRGCYFFLEARPRG